MKRFLGVLLTLVLVFSLAAIGLPSPVLAQPPEVWVDDDFTPATPGWGTTHFDNIQDGIDAVAGSTVHVAAGTYVENIILKDTVQLLGAGAEVTTINGGGSGSVVTAIDVGSETVVNGFTITNGVADKGGGIYCDNSSLTISNNLIVDNHAIQSDHPSYGGGGVYLGNGSNALIVNNTIEDNSANTHGGGIFFHFSSPTIRSNLIVGNVAALSVPYGQGGGIAGYGNSSATISNNLIINNSAVTIQPGVNDVGGGGIALDDGADAIVINNTIDGNSTVYGYGGGILCDWNASPTIVNNIITNSPDGEGIWVSSVGANPIIDYNNVWNNADGNYGGTAAPGPNDISDDPMFVNPAGSDYHVQASSPCVDAGTNEGAPTEDIEGTPRPVDGDGDTIAITDMGAYEYVPPTPQPPLPHAFYGDVLIDGNPAPVGTKVEVSGTNVRTGEDYNPIYTSETGKYGTSGPAGAKLIAQGDIDYGTTLTFYVNDVSTGQTFPFESGNITELDLSVTICSLTIASTEGGSVTVPGEAGPYTYDCGEDATITAMAEDCYQFTGWTGDTATIDDPASADTFITMNGNYSITANFELIQYTLDPSSTAGGSVTVPGEAGPYTYDCGEEVNLLAVAENCYNFTGWTGDPEAVAAIDDPTSADTFITMNGDYSITANFELIQYTLDPSSTAGGSVTVPGEAGPYIYDCGVDATITAVAETGYYFVNWTGDTATIDDPNSANTFITMNGDYAIMANFGMPGSLVDVAFNQGWNTFSTPISLHPGIDTWEEFITANELNVSMIYGYDAAAEEWVSVDDGDEIEPLYGFYVKTSAEGLAHIIPSANTTPEPTRELSRGVHLIGPAPASLEDIDVVSALESVYTVDDGITGYTMVVSPYINSPNDWAYVRDAPNPPIMSLGRAYWLVMENGGEFVGSSSTPLSP